MTAVVAEAAIEVAVANIVTKVAKRRNINTTTIIETVDAVIVGTKVRVLIDATGTVNVANVDMTVTTTKTMVTVQMMITNKKDLPSAGMIVIPKAKKTMRVARVAGSITSGTNIENGAEVSVDSQIALQVDSFRSDLCFSASGNLIVN